ncbi:MAG: hypothetical protein IKI31_01005 [Treponema sp.]|nr:hypothetical protein [Treponema sp.]
MKKFISLLAFCCLAFAVHSQSANFVTELLGTQKATYGQVSYLSAVYQGLVKENASQETALAELKKQKQIKDKVNVSDAVSYKELAGVFAKMWNIKGGLLFRASKRSPRYAFQQFKIDGIVPRDANPSKKVSGTDVLNVFSQCEYVYGGEK